MGVLFRRSGIDHFDLPAQSGFIPSTCIFMDRSLFDRYVYCGKCLGKEFFGFFAVLVCDRCSYGFYACPQDRFVSPVDQVPPKGSFPLANS